MIPVPQYPEYRLTLVWQADADGNGVRVYFERWEPDGVVRHLQTSFHPVLDLHEAVERALTHFFAEEEPTQS